MALHTLSRRTFPRLQRLGGRRRRNPDAPNNVPGAKWLGQVAAAKTTLTTEIRALVAALKEKGVAEAALPAPLDIRKHVEAVGIVLASMQYPELRHQSREDVPVAQIVYDLLGLSTLFATVEKEARPLVPGTFVSYVNEQRKASAAKREAAGVKIEAGQEEATRREAEDERDRLLAARAEIVEEDEEEEAEKEETPKEKKAREKREKRDAAAGRVVSEPEKKSASTSEIHTISRRGARIAGYEGKMARTRRRDIVPSAKVMAEAAKDILIYALDDGTAQVWIKGALTETYLPEQGRKSWQVAAGYAKRWLETPGGAGGFKKSRQGMRVITSTETAPEEFLVVVPARSTGTVTGKAPTIDQMRKKFELNPRTFRNPFGLIVANDVRAVFRANPVRTNGLDRKTLELIILNALTKEGSLTQNDIVWSDARLSPWTVSEALKRLLAAGRIRAVGLRFEKVLANPLRRNHHLRVGDRVEDRFGRTGTVVRTIAPDDYDVIFSGYGGRSMRAKGIYLTLIEERRNNSGLLLPAVLGVAGFVAGTYAEAEFGLSKQFTRGGKATVRATQTAVSAARSGRLPALPARQAPPPRSGMTTFAWKSQREAGGKGIIYTRTLNGYDYEVFWRADRKTGYVDVFDEGGRPTRIGEAATVVAGQALAEAHAARRSNRQSNPRAPYGFVSEGSGYRLLKDGEPTKTKYPTFAKAKADVTAKNVAWRAKSGK